MGNEVLHCVRQHTGLVHSFWKVAHGCKEFESSLFTASIPVPGFPVSRISKGKGRERKTRGSETVGGPQSRTQDLGIISLLPILQVLVT